jgi:hypothetical protein
MFLATNVRTISFMISNGVKSDRARDVQIVEYPVRITWRREEAEGDNLNNPIRLRRLRSWRYATEIFWSIIVIVAVFGGRMMSSIVGSAV